MNQQPSSGENWVEHDNQPGLRYENFGERRWNRVRIRETTFA
jgi:hypothetical protein